MPINGIIHRLHRFYNQLSNQLPLQIQKSPELWLIRVPLFNSASNGAGQFKHQTKYYWDFTRLSRWFLRIVAALFRLFTSLIVAAIRRIVVEIPIDLLIGRTQFRPDYWNVNVVIVLSRLTGGWIESSKYDWNESLLESASNQPTYF